MFKLNKKQLNYLLPILLCFVFDIYSCGYKISSGLKDSLKEKRLKLNTIKNLTTELGIEQEFIKCLHKGFLSQGVRLYSNEESADYYLDIVVKNISNVPLSYRQGINVAYTYEYEYSISVDIALFDSNVSQSIKRYSISENYIYFSADAPATTESNKRLAMVKVIDKIVDRFMREISLGI